MPRTVHCVLTDRDFQVTNENGPHHWHIDEPTEKGGGDTGPSPSESVLGALGACMAITAKMYARHKGFDLQEVRLQLNLSGNTPGQEAAIRIEAQLSGDLTPDQEKRIRTIMTKCPVSNLLKKPVQITLAEEP